MESHPKRVILCMFSCLELAQTSAPPTPIHTLSPSINNKQSKGKKNKQYIPISQSFNPPSSYTLMLRRGIPILTPTLRGTITVLLRLLRVTLMTTEPTSGNLGLEAAVLGRLPLTNVANVDVFALHWDQRNPAEFEPCSCFRLDDLGVVAAWTYACGSIALLFDLGWAAEDDRDEKAKVLTCDG